MLNFFKLLPDASSEVGVSCFAPAESSDPEALAIGRGLWCVWAHEGLVTYDSEAEARSANEMQRDSVVAYLLIPPQKRGEK